MSSWLIFNRRRIGDQDIAELELWPKIRRRTSPIFPIPHPSRSHEYLKCDECISLCKRIDSGERLSSGDCICADLKIAIARWGIQRKDFIERQK